MEHPVTPIQSDAKTDQVPMYRAQDLTQNGNQAAIELDGKIYSLRITRANKLILTK